MCVIYCLCYIPLVMSECYVLDRYNNKHISVQGVDEKILKKCTVGDKIVYELIMQESHETTKRKMSIGTYIGHSIDNCERKGIFARLLAWKEYDQFNKMQQDAKKIFPSFKKEFKKSFPTSIPVIAKYHLFSKQYYLYFYAEERFQFADFIRSFRSVLGANFFLFQVGARDMVKLSPATDAIVWCNGRSLCCKSTRPLPSVEVETIVLQQLEGRDIERLKWRCGKLKCSLLHEADLYLSETKRYPEKGEYVEDSCGTCGTCTSINVISWLITVDTKEWTPLQIDISDLKNKKMQPDGIA